MIQTASHLSRDAIEDIQTASPKPGLESSSIFTPVSYLVRRICRGGTAATSEDEWVVIRVMVSMVVSKIGYGIMGDTLGVGIRSLEVNWDQQVVSELVALRIDKDAEFTLVDETQGRYGDEEMFDTGVLDGDEVLAEPEVTVKDVNLSVDEVTLAQALAALKSEKVQEKANVVEEPSESITTTPTITTTIAATTITTISTRPRAKGLVIHKEEQATIPIVSFQQPSQVKAQDKGRGIF
ncbi:hypothetical protein Tco_1174691 [Tanacetum coccineum]